MSDGIFAAIAILTFAQVGVEYYSEHQVRLFSLVVFALACVGLLA